MVQIHLPPRPRILLYSHDAVGLGHLRRSLTIAAALAERFPGAQLLLATGSDCANHFRLPDGLDVVKLPTVGKDEDGRYRLRHLSGELGPILGVRQALLESLVDSFRPDVLLVDHKALGIADELEPVLLRARAQGCRTLLGLRDVLDEAPAAERELGQITRNHALEELYDVVCVHGHPSLFDLRTEYDLDPGLARNLRFTGYVVRPSGLPFAPVPSLEPRVLVTTGGGEDGAERVERYLEALEVEAPTWESVIVLGPLLDTHRARDLRRRAREMEHVRVHTFYEDMPRLVASAALAVTMAGYNTVAELLRCRVRSVLLPRTHPRQEQILRARRVSARGWGSCLVDPTPAALHHEIRDNLSRGRLSGELPPLDGAQRVSCVVGELLGQAAPEEVLG